MHTPLLPPETIARNTAKSFGLSPLQIFSAALDTDGNPHDWLRNLGAIARHEITQENKGEQTP